MDYLQHKELTPVIYDSSGIKRLPTQHLPPQGLYAPLHWHERLEITLVHAGSMKLMLGEETVEFHAGELAVINPSQLHGGFAGDNGVCYTTIMFEPASLLNSTQASYSLIKPLVDRVISFHNRCNTTHVIEVMETLMAELSLSDDSAPLVAQGKAYELLGLLYRYCLHPSAITAIDDDRFRTVLAYVNDHFCENLSSNSLCQQFGYSEAYFCRRFKAITDMTLTNYIRLLRLEKAQKLLCTKAMSIGELALACGFPDCGYFCRCFKVHFGLSPLQYRKLHFKK